MNSSARVALATILTVATSLAATTSVRHIAWDGMLQGRDGSKIRGLIEMVGGTVKGTTSAEIQFSGDSPGAIRRWHVHSGSCTKSGAILGAANAYPALTIDAKGATKAKATLRAQLPETGNYYVDLHESGATMGKIIACGDLLLAE